MVQPNDRKGLEMAGPTRLELATSGVTGRRSNQLNYGPAWSCFRAVVGMHYSRWIYFCPHHLLVETHSVPARKKRAYP